MAKDVEKIAFNLLERFTKWPKEVQKALSKSILHVFDPIRAINKKGILKLLTFLSQFSSEAIEEAAPLFLFYAELRVDAYKDWKFAMPGLYDDLIINKKDAEEFKKIMLDVIKRLQKEDVEKCFHFASSAEHLMRDGWKTSEEKDRYTEIALEHFNILTNIYSHNIFNLIYMVLEKSFESKDEYTNQWISLLIKCLRIEDTFYKEQVQKGNARNVSWYPAFIPLKDSRKTPSKY